MPTVPSLTWSTPHPVIDLMLEQRAIEDLGGTMRLGEYPCVLAPNSLASQAYDTGEIMERHRHRFEFNNDYRDLFAANGVCFSGMSPDGNPGGDDGAARSSIYAGLPVSSRVFEPAQSAAPAVFRLDSGLSRVPRRAWSFARAFVAGYGQKLSGRSHKGGLAGKSSLIVLPYCRRRWNES